ncbi:hypothetical protein [Streptomyces sp. NBC_00467]
MITADHLDCAVADLIGLITDLNVDVQKVLATSCGVVQVHAGAM